MASLHPSASSFENVNPVLSVQELIKKPMDSVPQLYVARFDDEETLANSHSFSTAIPTFDFEQLISKETSDLQIQKLHSTCKEWGI